MALHNFVRDEDLLIDFFVVFLPILFSVFQVLHYKGFPELNSGGDIPIVTQSLLQGLVPLSQPDQ